VAELAYNFVIDWMDSRDVRERTRKLFGTGVVAYAIVVLLVYITYSAQAVPSVAAKFAPSDALNRAGKINNQQNSYVGRLDLTKTAFRMALDYPLNGLGGEGWNSLYHRYQPYLMYSSETHNYPAKVLVETGFIGLFIFIGIWVLYIKKLYRLWRAELDDDSWILVWSCGLAAVTLGMHSVYDFDLSMGAMGILLWSLWGIIMASANLHLINVQETGIKLSKMLRAGLAGTIFACSQSLCRRKCRRRGCQGHARQKLDRG